MIFTKSIAKLDIWEYVRNKLKNAGLAKYYNRIPAILAMARYDCGKCIIPHDAYTNILQDFSRMHFIFPRIKDDVGRSYFPSLRYVAARLMMKHGIRTEWTFTVIRTRHKHLELDYIFSVMWDAIWQEDVMNLFLK